MFTKSDLSTFLLILLFIVINPVHGQPGKGNENTNNRDVYFVPFSHFDLMWAGTREECLSKSNRIIAKAIQLANESPEFRFLLEDNVFAANFMDSHRGSPEADELKLLVKEGRIEHSIKTIKLILNPDQQ